MTLALATFLASLGLTPEPKPVRVEFRVVRLPAGYGLAPPSTPIINPLGDGGKYPDIRYQMLPTFRHENSNRVLRQDWAGPSQVESDGLTDAGGLPGWDVGIVPLWLRTAELSGPKLQVGRRPMTATLTRPEWAVHTESREPPAHSAWQRVLITTREVLVTEATFTASAVPTDGGRFKVCVRYTETELPSAKVSAPPLSAYLSPFYADAPHPQSPVPSFRQPGVVTGADLAVLRPGESVTFSAGRSAVRRGEFPLSTRMERLTQRGEVEEDVVVIATVRE